MKHLKFEETIKSNYFLEIIIEHIKLRAHMDTNIHKDTHTYNH